jgi:hypothetical protein
MTDRHPEDAARKAWSNQPDEDVRVDLPQARRELAAREAGVRKRDRVAYTSALIIAPSWAAVMWFMPDLRIVAAVGFSLAVWIPAMVYLRSGARLIPAADGTCFSFQQALLQRELEFRKTMPRWYLLPVALSQVAILWALFTSPRFSQTAQLFWAAGALIGTAATVLLVARKRLKREAADLQRELNLLNAAAGGDILATSKG